MPKPRYQDKITRPQHPLSTATNMPWQGAEFALVDCLALRRRTNFWAMRCLSFDQRLPLPIAHSRSSRTDISRHLPLHKLFAVFKPLLHINWAANSPPRCDYQADREI